MLHASARPLALAWQLRSVFRSRSTFLASSSQHWLSTSATSAAEASAASKESTEKKPSTSTATTEKHDPKKKKNEPQNKPESKEEIGGPRGPEPTRYNDWEKHGRVSDF